MGLPMSDEYQKPVPREPKSPSKLAQLQVQNRRREFLQRHPSYFNSTEHELADPVLYERLVKRFQSASEREAEKKNKGYGLTLEADLARGEAKLASIAPQAEGARNEAEASNRTGSGLDQAWEQPTGDKARGLELWHVFLTERFIQGDDGDFDYSAVDTNEDLDVMTRRDAEDAWFDEEEPSWQDNTVGPSGQTRQGETGIQDF